MNIEVVEYCDRCGTIIDEDAGRDEFCGGVVVVCGECAESMTMPEDNWW